MGVAGLGKPYYTPCPHECSKGCSIYGNHPDDCKHFECLWLSGAIKGEQRRPDRLGLMFGYFPTSAGDTLLCYETRSNAAAEYGYEKIKYLCKGEDVMVFPYGWEERVNFEIADQWADKKHLTRKSHGLYRVYGDMESGCLVVHHAGEDLC